MKKWKFWKKTYDEQEEPDELDVLLYKYMPKYEEKMMEELENEVDYDYEFSDNYRRKMERLVRKERYIVPMRIVKRVAMGIVAVIITFFISMYCGVVQGNAQWTNLYETLKTIWEDSFVYSYFKKTDMELSIIYEPMYVPEGYELVEKIENPRMYDWIYEKDNNKIHLRQLMIENEGRLIVDADFVKEKIIRKEDMEIFVYYYKDGRICTYYEYLESTFIIHAEELNEEEMIKIYEGWVK